MTYSVFLSIMSFMENKKKHLIGVDPQTGKRPTESQLKILFALNPCKGNPTYEQAAKKLRITVSTLKTQMARFKKNCPVLHQRFETLKKNIPSLTRSSIFSFDEISEYLYLEKDEKYIDTSDRPSSYKIKIKRVF